MRPPSRRGELGHYDAPLAVAVATIPADGSHDPAPTISPPSPAGWSGTPTRQRCRPTPSAEPSLTPRPAGTQRGRSAPGSARWANEHGQVMRIGQTEQRMSLLADRPGTFRGLG